VSGVQCDQILCEVFSEEIKKLKKIRELREIPEFLMIFLNAVHRVVFGWPALDHMLWLENILINSQKFHRSGKLDPALLYSTNFFTHRENRKNIF
jgi:ATP-dependent RNA circularization protein (DNA/RNA ligase family)